MASLKVVHTYGPCSHLKRAPTVTEVLSHDQSRVNSIHSGLRFNSGRNNLQDSKATLPANSGTSVGGAGNYIVTIGLGTPKNDLSLFFDTGSDVTWTQYEPCAGSCYKQQEPIFDPSMSQTYKNITCDSPQCSQLTSSTGNSSFCSSATCFYGILYGDNSFYVGFFATETLTLTPTDVFPNFLFGCGQDNEGLFVGGAGFLGLGRDKLSLVSQTASEYGNYFSYCLPTMSGSGGHPTLGKEGSSSNTLKFTSLIMNSQDPSFYFIDVTGISVAGQSLSISPTVFKIAGTIIDSGTVITYLPPEACTALRTAFRQQMTQYPTTQPVSTFDTCYDLSNNNTILIPTISFYFSGSVEVPLDPLGILYVFEGSVSQVFLAFAGNRDASDLGIFGNTQQQTLEAVYDVAGEKLGFGTGGCSQALS